MGRVSDAMRRAGRHEGEPAESAADDASFFPGGESEFVSGEDAETERAVYTFDSAEPKALQPVEPLVAATARGSN